jgi:hypothetical protein
MQVKHSETALLWFFWGQLCAYIPTFISIYAFLFSFSILYASLVSNFAAYIITHDRVLLYGRALGYVEGCDLHEFALRQIAFVGRLNDFVKYLLSDQFIVYTKEILCLKNFFKFHSSTKLLY